MFVHEISAVREFLSIEIPWSVLLVVPLLALLSIGRWAYYRIREVRTRRRYRSPRVIDRITYLSRH